MKQLNTKLTREFEIKYLGQVQYFLGIKVIRSKNGIFLSQRKYMLDLLIETGILGCKPVMVPIDPHHKFKEDPDDQLIDAGRYQRLVGCLIYLSLTRPNIAYAVSVVTC